MLETERLIIQPYSNSFLEEYYKEFTDEITKYQYPDSFSNINTANEIVSGFVKDMEQGNMLELVILTQEGEFIGSMEAFGIKEKTPEIGLWLKRSAHGKGYGYEALNIAARAAYSLSGPPPAARKPRFRVSSQRGGTTIFPAPRLTETQKSRFKSIGRGT